MVQLLYRNARQMKKIVEATYTSSNLKASFGDQTLPVLEGHKFCDLSDVSTQLKYGSQYSHA